MQFQLTLLPLLAAVGTVSAAAPTSFYDFSIYTDSACSIDISGFSGSTNKTCTALPNSAGSEPALYFQSGGFIGTCQILLYSDDACCEEVGGFGSPPNLGCVSGGEGAGFYEVSGC